MINSEPACIAVNTSTIEGSKWVLVENNTEEDSSIEKRSLKFIILNFLFAWRKCDYTKSRMFGTIAS
jgi:hypothetical protein